MATGILKVYPRSIEGFPISDYPEDSMIILMFSVTRGETRNTRPTIAYGLNWDVELHLFVPEGEDTLTIRVLDEETGPLATVTVELDQVFSQHDDAKLVPLKTDGGRSLGKLNLSLEFDLNKVVGILEMTLMAQKRSFFMSNLINVCLDEGGTNAHLNDKPWTKCGHVGQQSLADLSRREDAQRYPKRPPSHYFLSHEVFGCVSFAFFIVQPHFLLFIMSKIKSLPTEILIDIFKKLESSSQAAQCRLICTAWNVPAEIAMLHNVKLYGSNNMQKLLEILARTPTKAKWITCIDVSGYNNDESWRQELLRLVITSNIESMKGDNDYDSSLLLQEMLKILESSATRFDKMKRIAIGVIRHPEIGDYMRLLLHFQDSLEYLEMDYGNEGFVELDKVYKDFRDLSKLKKLNTLSLTIPVEFESITAVEEFLNSVAQVDTLALVADSWSDEEGPNELEWNESSVEQVGQLKVLKIKAYNHFANNCLDYLVYKYTNLQQIDITLLDLDLTTVDFSIIRRQLNAVSSVPRRRVMTYTYNKKSAGNIMANLVECGYTIEATMAIKRNQRLYLIEIKNI
ncbi:hypothetical protein MBANPS3_000608 [Mucor bainieri]